MYGVALCDQKVNAGNEVCLRESCWWTGEIKNLLYVISSATAGNLGTRIR